MKTPSTWWPAAAALLLLSPTATATAATNLPSTPAPAAAAAAPAPLACDSILVPSGDNNNGNGEGKGGKEKGGKDQHKYDLRALVGPHVVVTHEYTSPTYHNTTYAIDVCAPLRRKRDVDGGGKCPDGTQVCAIKHRWDHKEDKSAGIDQVIPIVVGDEHKAITWNAKRLPGKAGDGEAEKGGKKEGLKLTLQGHTTYQGRAQRTVVEFRCNPDLEGTENEWESVDVYEPGEKKNGRREEEGGKDGDKEGDKKDEKGDDKGDNNEDPSTPEKQLKKSGAALVWDGYKRETGEDGAEMDTLYLTWYTKHVCDTAVDEPEPAGESAHWGFFTWLVIL
ncbi:hypothetical protein CHGG_08229 [Chaetomium globosum CBS 148.51]|uniref:Autophagy-related protein 27 n=1 Tax=Chaetomium globosum (strain ATCC 6205 / CBS 148.51 / DSM 1962 / NBRC 6347 / NRRL 1970) TaxID=306901 RepID=Q2GUX5_CHAGB|nr:uncharacterized protein CHGG_08229 [Chaetomium globosum CBS 148.51]EAQ86976.1 hypothetical protein CHGG_08229 [Chaetomium globosum CBS 148.51]